MAFIKIHTSRYWRKTVGMCDDEVLGKEFVEGKKCLKVHPEFYQGFRASDEDIVRHAKQSYMINAVGHKVIDILVQAGIVHKSDIQWIEGVPYVQVLFEM